MAILSATHDERVKFLFDDPRRRIEDHRTDGLCSILYLLRRELLETLGYDPLIQTEDDARRGGARRRLFASTILMFTTCDLIAKFLLGDRGKVGERFTDFLQHSDAAALSADEAEVL